MNDMCRYKTSWAIKGYGAMVEECCPLKAIWISNATSCDDAGRTDWNVTGATDGRLTSPWEVIMEHRLYLG